MHSSPPCHLYGRWQDVLLLGGASVFAFIACRLVDWTPDKVGLLAALMLVLAHFVNHPHFAHSYQLFYSQIRQRVEAASGSIEKKKLLVIAFVIPAVLATLLLYGAIEWRTGNRFPMGLMINLMGALVGWHYVKQGFGMAMTDAALKRTYWSSTARRALLFNAYLCWVLTWLYLNASAVGTQFWGIFYARMSVPMPLVFITAGLTLLSTLCTGVLVHRDFRQHRATGVAYAHLPWAGLVGYTVSLYLWTVFASVDPAYLLVIPFFHSVQYLTVVYRCKWHETGRGLGTAASHWSLVRFVLLGLVLGWLGFWAVPGYLDFSRIEWMWAPTSVPALAIACFWLFINVHHYFIDNVLWRSTNPYVKIHLFGATSSATSIPSRSAGLVVR